MSFCAAPALAEDTPPSVHVYTHGEGEFGLLQADGTLRGSAIDSLACAMQRMGQPYSVNVASMARSFGLEQDGLMDIWFPTYETGDPDFDRRLVGPLGQMAIYWFTPKTAALQPGQAEFKADARVTSFPGSRPEKILRTEGFRFTAGTDDQDRLVLWLLEGRVDAVLAADFRDALQPGTSHLAKQLEVTLYRNLAVGFELIPAFTAKYPGFRDRFQHAFDACRD